MSSGTICVLSSPCCFCPAIAEPFTLQQILFSLIQTINAIELVTFTSRDNIPHLQTASNTSNHPPCPTSSKTSKKPSIPKSANKPPSPTTTHTSAVPIPTPTTTKPRPSSTQRPIPHNKCLLQRAMCPTPRRQRQRRSHARWHPGPRRTAETWVE
ncbi:hypothetical protein SMACR_07731 [Sordaria macrospora]|uniref:Uncharacterized protein n=1 Tax=Sordaria macrospora TaxID=5147 RepID=A0A8S8ZNL4_SORMA|nr:hypothetical protein SMACR_07731 [Sordaria macrospora]